MVNCDTVSQAGLKSGRYKMVSRMTTMIKITILLPGLLLMCCVGQAAPTGYSWHAADRADRVARLIPGRRIPMPPPEDFLADRTRRQVERWQETHGEWSADDAYAGYAAAERSDEDLVAYIPDHISPFGRVLSGAPIPEPTKSVLSPKEARVLINYCPFCGKEHPNVEYQDSRMFTLDPENPFHAWTTCCTTHLYEREKDYPADYGLRPNRITEFTHLDDTVKRVPATVYTDDRGVEWELYIGTTIAHKRWVRTGEMAIEWLEKFRESADPLYVHKLAVLLDRVADVYYGLPPSFRNLVMEGTDGGPLTRAEWEAMSRPVRSTPDLDTRFYWNRRLPLVNCGWLFLFKEYLWVEPFARVRHHPSFKTYSAKTYGDPDALDRKIMQKLMRDIALMFESIVLKSGYQDGHYTELMMLGILLENRYLFDFAAAHQECVLYNHHYYDGMTAEGAPNYMNMLEPYYRHTADPKGWLEFAPDFLARNPFFPVARSQWKQLRTIRGQYLEFGDQIIFTWNPPDEFSLSSAVRANESRPSMNWPGFGVGILRVGGPGHRQEVCMTYDRQSLHSAADKLGIECWVDGVPVMREGGYAAKSRHVVIDPSRPEFKALMAMPYPRTIIPLSPPGESEGWLQPWAHGLLAHNTASVNDLGTAPGWEGEGIGELVTFKGGEAPGETGAGFQVLDCRDRYSFERYAETKRMEPVEVAEYRRALLAVEGPDGRPYLVDIFRIEGGDRHALYQSAWAERTNEDLPSVESRWSNMLDYLEGAGAPPLHDAWGDTKKNLRRLKRVEVLGTPPDQWGVTWRADYAAYQPCDPNGSALPRALEDNAGFARLRLIGLTQPGRTTLLNGKGPWVAWIDQPLPNGERATGDVGFRDAWDYLIERRTTDKTTSEGPLRSTFVHLLEGYRDDETSAIRNVSNLAPADPAGAGEDAVGIELNMAGGHTDTVVFQAAPGEARFKNGLATDARYALVRQDTDGRVVEAHMVRGTRLEYGDFSATSAGDLEGTLVDLVGDLTGTRLESALIVRPESPWPRQENLAGRQLTIQVLNHHHEGYTIEKVTPLEDGLLRVDLANHPPFTGGWYQVNLLDAQKRNRLLSSRTITQGMYSPWWNGWKAWFPERDRTYTIHETGGSSVENFRARVDFVEDVDLQAEGIRPGDWFTIYGIEPGLKVTVPGEYSWRADTAHKENDSG